MTRHSPHISIPKQAQDAADRGDLIAAIKLTQEVMGVGLNDAQAAVHAFVRGEHANSFATDAPIPAQALAALQRGNKIEAIKYTRNATGLGLKEAKDAVENYLARNPNAQQQFNSVTAQGRVNLAPLIALVALIGLGVAAAALFFFARSN